MDQNKDRGYTSIDNMLKDEECPFLKEVIADICVLLGVKVIKGAIVVNGHMEISVEVVYAAGDVIGGSLLAPPGLCRG